MRRRGKVIWTTAIAIALTMFALATPMASATCNRGSLNVAFVPSQGGPGGGSLAINHAAFSGFSFTDVPYASVNAATLASYDTVILITCDPMTDLNGTQRSDIVNWVNNGGKLIIYDSECTWNATVDYTWLPCRAITFCPGAYGATKYGYPWVDLTIVEESTLSSTDPTSPYYINASMIAYNTDAVGDQNVFIVRDPCWCGDMIGTNVLDSAGNASAPGTTGYSHAYTHYGNGLIIYNGLDIDYMSGNSDPTGATGDGYLAKIWLPELNQTWDNTSGLDVCNLPCGAPIPPPMQSAAAPTTTPIGLIALAGVLSIIATISIGTGMRKRG